MFTLLPLFGSISGSRNGDYLASDLQHTCPYCFFVLEILKQILVPAILCFVSLIAKLALSKSSNTCYNNIIGTHKLNWLSTLWKTSADEQVNHAQVETFTALAVAISQLGIVSSVAASVARSLLLMSGDVEENPGPGGR